MTRTYRWFHKPQNRFRLSDSRQFEITCPEPWNALNPFYFRHEFKQIRKKMHRALRRNNKIFLQKGWEIQSFQNTNGWNTW